MGTREATAAHGHGPVGQGGQRLSITAYAGAGPAAAPQAGAALSEFGEALATASLDGLPDEAPGIPADSGSPGEATPVPRIPGAAPGGELRPGLAEPWPEAWAQQTEEQPIQGKPEAGRAGAGWFGVGAGLPFLADPESAQSSTDRSAYDQDGMGEPLAAELAAPPAAPAPFQSPTLSPAPLLSDGLPEAESGWAATGAAGEARPPSLLQPAVQGQRLMAALPGPPPADTQESPPLNATGSGAAVPGTPPAAPVHLPAGTVPPTMVTSPPALSITDPVASPAKGVEPMASSPAVYPADPMRSLEPIVSASWAALSVQDAVAPDTGLNPDAPADAAGAFDVRPDGAGRDGREGSGPGWQSAWIEQSEAGSYDGERLADDAWLPAAPTQQSAAVPGRAGGVQAGLPPVLADQVAAAAAALSQGQSGPGTVSLALDPDELGRIGITVELKADGTTTVHVQAERLATLELLRADQAVLMRALDRPGQGEGGHALSFSWSGGGQPAWGAWGAMDDPSGLPAPAGAAGEAYAPARSAQLPRASSRGGVDVTA